MFWFDYDLQWCNKLINISVWSLIGLACEVSINVCSSESRIPRRRNSGAWKQLGSVTNWQVNVDHWADRWSGLAAMILTRPWHFCWTSRIPAAATSGKLPVAYGLKLWDSVVHVNHIHVVHVKCSCNNCLPSVKLIDTSKRLDRLYLTYPIFYMHIVIILVCKESKFSFKFYPLENELKP